MADRDVSEELVARRPSIKTGTARRLGLRRPAADRFSQWLSAVGLPPLIRWQAALLTQMTTMKEADHG